MNLIYDKKMNNNIYKIIALISTIGILCWIITNFFGGMILHLLSYYFIIIPIIILYIFSFFETIISTIKHGIKQNMIKIFFHGIVLFTILLFNLFESDLLKSKNILTATLKDDLYHYTLIFRKDGSCENKISGIFGFEEVFYGKYKFNGDTIIFSKIPYDNDFIPPQLLIDKKNKVIFINKDKLGQFETTIEWLNHFEIQ